MRWHILNFWRNNLSPPLSCNEFTEEYEIDGISVDEETYQAKWQALYEEQAYILVIYEEGIPIREKGLKRSLAGAVDRCLQVPAK